MKTKVTNFRSRTNFQESKSFEVDLKTHFLRALTVELFRGSDAFGITGSEEPDDEIDVTHLGKSCDIERHEAKKTGMIERRARDVAGGKQLCRRCAAETSRETRKSYDRNIYRSVPFLPPHRCVSSDVSTTSGAAPTPFPLLSQTADIPRRPPPGSPSSTSTTTTPR